MKLRLGIQRNHGVLSGIDVRCWRLRFEGAGGCCVVSHACGGCCGGEAYVGSTERVCITPTERMVVDTSTGKLSRRLTTRKRAVRTSCHGPFDGASDVTSGALVGMAKLDLDETVGASWHVSWQFVEFAIACVHNHPLSMRDVDSFGTYSTGLLLSSSNRTLAAQHRIRPLVQASHGNNSARAWFYEGMIKEKLFHSTL